MSNEDKELLELVNAKRKELDAKEQKLLDHLNKVHAQRIKLAHQDPSYSKHVRQQKYKWFIASQTMLFLSGCVLTLGATLVVLGTATYVGWSLMGLSMLVKVLHRIFYERSKQ